MPDTDQVSSQHKQFEVFNCPNGKEQDESQLSVRPKREKKEEKKNDSVSTVWQDDR